MQILVGYSVDEKMLLINIAINQTFIAKFPLQKEPFFIRSANLTIP